MEVLEWIAKYWIEWLCVLASGSMALLFKRHLKFRKEHLEAEQKERESKLYERIVQKLEEEISGVEVMSKIEDEEIHEDLHNIHEELNYVTSGMLSLQGKQFKDFCEHLLNADHVISTEEYEEFEVEYKTYKDLHGNHRGDVLHDRVVDKMKAQIAASV